MSKINSLRLFAVLVYLLAKYVIKLRVTTHNTRPATLNSKQAVLDNNNPPDAFWCASQLGTYSIHRYYYRIATQSYDVITRTAFY